MSASDFPEQARTSLRAAPYFLAGAIVAAFITLYWGVASPTYLLACVALGAAWFGLLALTWRARSNGLQFVSLMFAVFGHAILRGLMVHRNAPEEFQGVFVSMVVMLALQMVLERSLYKFARLESVTSPSGEK